MKVLVTGATGAIGQAVVTRLLSDGHEVAIATRRPFLAERLYGTAITIHEWHPLSEPLPRAALADCDGIISLMGAPIAGGRKHNREMLAIASRTNAIRRINEATAGRDLRMVVASLAHAPAGVGEPLRDADLSSPPTFPMARMVSEWEADALAAIGRAGSAAVVRLGLVDAESCVLRELVRLARIGIVPRLKGALIPAITLDDAAAMLVGMLNQREIVGLVHGVAPTPVTGEALMAALRSVAPVRPLVLPLSVLRRRLGLAVALLGCQRRIVPDILVHAGADFATDDPTDRLAQAISAIASGAAREPPPLAPGVPSTAIPPVASGTPDGTVVLKPLP